MPAKKATKKTGSQKLSAKKGAKAAAGGELNKVLATLKAARIKNDILIKGQPLPDIIKGSFTATSPGQVGAALAAILAAKNVQYKPVQLFPRGIPVIKDIVGQIDGKLVK